MLAVLALVMALQQDSPVMDQPVYASAEWGVSLRRPFDDWVFSPATERGTTTVIFQPRDGSLADQLWGAIILSRWGRPVPLAQVASRRIASTWRSALGSSFDMRARDSLEVEGYPAIHMVMSGVIGRAAVDVEEYLIARDSDLIALQFRYPRGLPRDSIAAGYLRSLAGLTLRGSVAPAAHAEWSLAMQRDFITFNLPADQQAIAPGWLSSEVVANGRRIMRWTALVGAPDSSLFVIGQFRAEPRRVGRLTIRVWRNLAADSTIARANDEVLDVLARAWAVYWQDFGPVPTAEVAVVETAERATRGGPGFIALGSDASATVLQRELARTWWGGVVRAEGASARLISELLPEWAIGRPGVIERVRRTAGDAAFREALRTLVVESRGGPPAMDRFLSILGDPAASELRSALR